MTRQEAYSLIDGAKEGSIFFRFAISPDAQKEDTRRDLHLREITEKMMRMLGERLHKQISWVGAVHDDHAPHRHVHVIAVIEGRLQVADLQALTKEATAACIVQRIE